VNRTSATVVADSVSPAGVRLSSLECVIHPAGVEHLLRHRSFSLSAASKRAIPLAKQLAEVEADPCYPAEFTTEQKGMQGGPALSGAALGAAQGIWNAARSDAIMHARNLGNLGVHKEVASRPLQPYQWRTYLITATDWDGFFAQRAEGTGAQRDIVLLAEAIRAALLASEPREVGYGDWHLPYITDEDMDWRAHTEIDPRQVSAARVARVSYLTQHGVRDPRADLDLFHRLRRPEYGPPHWSPMEPVATPASPWPHPRPIGNFRGWTQLRHIEEGNA
jgi:hypothetical protein